MSAVEESRQAVNDRTTGLGKLAKYIDTCYPQSGGGGKDDDKEESIGFKGRVGRWFGLGQGGQATRPDNNLRADMVTPFFPDNYGG